MTKTMKAGVAFDEIDLRVAVGRPYQDLPIKMNCPDHVHYPRVRKHDDKSSMAVYHDHLYCYGCGFLLRLRFSALAFLLGKWDGMGDEWGSAGREAAGKVKAELPKFIHSVNTGEGVESSYKTALDLYAPRSFHLYMLKYERDRMDKELVQKRGLTYETIEACGLGHTGTHFSIPVYDRNSELVGIRFRSDDVRTDRRNTAKYSAIRGHNEPSLYPLRVLQGLSHVETLWIVEGEYDAISVNQAGEVCLTCTNGSSTISSKIVGMIFDLGVAVGFWILALDQDGPGDKAARDIAAELDGRGQRHVRARWSPGKDLTEYLAAGNGLEGVTYE